MAGEIAVVAGPRIQWKACSKAELGDAYKKSSARLLATSDANAYQIFGRAARIL
jgi:hypothetical protein